MIKVCLTISVTLLNLLHKDEIESIIEDNDNGTYQVIFDEPPEGEYLLSLCMLIFFLICKDTRLLLD